MLLFFVLSLAATTVFIMRETSFTSVIIFLVGGLLLNFQITLNCHREWMLLNSRDRFTDQFDNIFQIGHFFRITKCEGSSVCSGATCTANAVHIRFGFIRNIKIDYI
ncbi:hypothetical protein D3C78_1651100 [compost metagenome]